MIGNDIQTPDDNRVDDIGSDPVDTLGHAIRFLGNHLYAIGTQREREFGDVDIFAESTPMALQEAMVRALKAAANYVERSFTEA